MKPFGAHSWKDKKIRKVCEGAQEKCLMSPPTGRIRAVSQRRQSRGGGLKAWQDKTSEAKTM